MNIVMSLYVAMLCMYLKVPGIQDRKKSMYLKPLSLKPLSRVSHSLTYSPPLPCGTGLISLQGGQGVTVPSTAVPSTSAHAHG
jgi:hypothetical protein